VSLAAQEARLRAYCTAAGLTLVEIMRDEGVSASKPLDKRPAGMALMRALARKQARHVVVVTLDRMFRSTVDCLSKVGDLGPGRHRPATWSTMAGSRSPPRPPSAACS